MQLLPSELCGDSEFVRRAALDLCGRLPTAKEAADILAAASADKRDRLMDRLLEDPAHLDFWTMKWLDVLRATRRNLGGPGLAAYHGWLRGHVEKNTPFDRVAHELVTADRRPALAAWLTSAENPYFARAVVNRVWFHLMGRGIVDPVDDFRESNPASQPEVLDHLSREFAEGYDVRKLIRTVMRSRVYQLSARANGTNRDDARYFSVARPRMLTAEQAYEAIREVTEVRDKLPGGPDVRRVAAVVDTDAFVKNARAFLKAFHQPARELACECDRPAETHLGQALQVLNGLALQDCLAAGNNRSGRLIRGSSRPGVVPTLTRPIHGSHDDAISPAFTRGLTNQ